MPAKKSLIILTPGFPESEEDVNCLPFPQLFVKTLLQMNPSLQVTVLAFHYPFMACTYTWHGATVIAFNGRSRGKLYKLVMWHAVWKQLRRLLKQDSNAGILSFWLGECALMGKLAAKKYSVLHHSWLLGQDAKKGNRYFSFIKPQPENLVALSDFLADEFYRNYGIRPAHTIPPGIDCFAFPDQPHQKDIDIIGTGSLIPLKQYDIFIAVVKKLVANFPNIKTIICGEGREKNRLQQLVEDAGLSKNIQLTGALPHNAVLALMQRSKILLHPSRYEGFATVYTEALYAGAQVVGFCKPMNGSIQNLHLVPTEAAMADTVRQLLTENQFSGERILFNSIEKTCADVLALHWH